MIELDCQVVSWSYPKPTISWSKFRGGHNYESITKAHQYQFLQIGIEDCLIGDRFTCLVENQLGNVTRTYEIVLSKSKVAMINETRRRRLVTFGAFASGFTLVFIVIICLYLFCFKGGRIKNIAIFNQQQKQPQRRPTGDGNRKRVRFAGDVNIQMASSLGSINNNSNNNNSGSSISEERPLIGNDRKC